MTANAPTIIIPAVGPDGALYPVEKLTAHAQSLLHLAVSVFVFDRGELLIQQRATDKYHCGDLWANTCCSHPDWGEDLTECAARRLQQEMGFTIPLVESGQVEYFADVGKGLSEHERVTFFVGRARRKDLVVRPNPREVRASRWISRKSLEAEIASKPEQFAPWFRIYVAQHADMIFEQ